MNAAHPAITLLFLTGLTLFWLMPLTAWLMLRGQQDVKARLWFGGTACYAVTALLFTLQGRFPTWLSFSLGGAFAVTMLVLLFESLRREVSDAPTPWVALGAAVVVDGVGMLVLDLEGMLEAVGRPLHLTAMSLLDLAVAVMLVRVIRRHRSRALVIVLVAFVVAIFSNVLRVYTQVVLGGSARLLDFTPVSNFSFLVNFVAVIFYSFGYWGFVVEKNRQAQLEAVAEATRAGERERAALAREEETRALMREREELVSRLAVMGKMAQTGALSASIAHEVNQPLASVLLNAEEALEAVRREGGSERLQQLIQTVVDENRRAAQTIESVKRIFGPEPSGREPVQLGRVVERVCDLVRQQARRQGVTLEAKLSAPCLVLGAGGEFEHVILNLVLNALDAHKGSREPGRHVRVSTERLGERVQLTVADNGPGIPEPLRGRLFDLMRSEKSGGLGLGLWLARYIVERHCGSIRFEPAVGRGATFVVDLPCLEPQMAGDGAGAATAPLAAGA